MSCVSLGAPFTPTQNGLSKNCTDEPVRNTAAQRFPVCTLSASVTVVSPLVVAEMLAVVPLNSTRRV